VAWLASHPGWLVLDNVTDPGHVKALLGRAPAGRFVITSRRGTGWHGIAAPLPLDVLDPAEARQLLEGILTHGRDPGPGGLDGADALCADLGYLPLALEHAGAYIAETGITPAQYLRAGGADGFPVDAGQLEQGLDVSDPVQRHVHCTAAGDLALATGGGGDPPGGDGVVEVGAAESAQVHEFLAAAQPEPARGSAIIVPPGNGFADMSATGGSYLMTAVSGLPKAPAVTERS